MRRLPVLLLACLALACAPSPGEDAGLPDGKGGHDAGHVDGGSEDAGLDSGPPDAGAEDAGAHDAGTNDAGTDADAGADAGSDDAGSDDAGSDDAGGSDGGQGGDEVEAVLGGRCEPAERVGLVEITSWGGDSYSANAELYDAPRPWFGPAALADESCAYYVGASGCGCEVDEVCAFGGGCAPAPSPVGGLSVLLRAGDEELLLEESGQPGNVYGAVTLPGATFSVELSAGDLRVLVPAMTVPGTLTGASGVMQGDSMAPEGLDFSWTPTAAGVDVFTHIPMNHHVAAPTFTECRVDGSGGELHVTGAMLAPLALVTGLEFQTLDTARFAAATTALGCVEVRFTRKHFVSPG